MDGWNTIVSFWGPAHFQGLLLLVSGRVFFTHIPKNQPHHLDPYSFNFLFPGQFLCFLHLLRYLVQDIFVSGVSTYQWCLKFLDPRFQTLKLWKTTLARKHTLWILQTSPTNDSLMNSCSLYRSWSRSSSLNFSLRFFFLSFSLRSFSRLCFSCQSHTKKKTRMYWMQKMQQKADPRQSANQIWPPAKAQFRSPGCFFKLTDLLNFSLSFGLQETEGNAVHNVSLGIRMIQYESCIWKTCENQQMMKRKQWPQNRGFRDRGDISWYPREV